jgi:hypothetical protein
VERVTDIAFGCDAMCGIFNPMSTRVQYYSLLLWKKQPAVDPKSNLRDFFPPSRLVSCLPLKKCYVSFFHGFFSD